VQSIVYENGERQAEGFAESQKRQGFDSTQLFHLFMSLLSRDVLDMKTHELRVS
jgi:hypothetical protein